MCMFSFSAAISACEKGGQWERALLLLDEMRRCGVKQDIFGFSAAISACAKGGQWERALSLLNEMRESGVEPNEFSYSSAIQACARAGQADVAMRLFEALEVAEAVNAEVVTFNAILDAVCEQRSNATMLWKLACSRGCYPGAVSWGDVPQLDLHCMSEGAAETAVRWWLQEGVAEGAAAAAGSVPPERLELITGWGKSRPTTQDSDVRLRVHEVLRQMGAETRPTDNPGLFVVEAERWLRPRARGGLSPAPGERI